MSLTLPDMKILWGRAGAKCAMCKCNLAPDMESAVGEYVLGEQAHIVGEKEGAARGKSTLTEAERECYSNRILLCPTHHTEIDKDEDSYSIERLHQIKTEHEQWVEERLSMPDRWRQAEDEIYANLVQSAADFCMFDDWATWTANLLMPRVRIQYQSDIRLIKFVRCYLKAPLPGRHAGLESALETLYLTIEHLRRILHKNVELCDDWLRAVPFYKLEPDTPAYHEDLARYEAWESEVHSCTIEASKAANWVADETRAHLNPLFYALEGRFEVCEGPFMSIDSVTWVPQFTEEERALQPHAARLRLPPLPEE